VTEIPEEAVTAAAGRLWHRLEGVGRDQCVSIAEEALAAAVPHILREAAKPQFEQAIRELADIEFRKRLPETLAVVNDSVEAALYPRVAELVEAAKAAERERAEALIVQAQDYASAESERAGKAVTLAGTILAQCRELERDDRAPYLTEWSLALDQIDGAAGEMSPPDSDPLEEANQAGIRWERERCIRVLERQAAAPISVQSPIASQALREAADLLREDGNG
jgi:hypothetical protein